MNWFQYLNLAFQLLGAVEQVAAALQADQPFTTQPIYASPFGKKYAITVNGTPQA